MTIVLTVKVCRDQVPMIDLDLDLESRSSSSSESDREINRNVPALSSRLSRKADKRKRVPRKALSSPQGVFQTISHPRASALRQQTKLFSVFFFSFFLTFWALTFCSLL